MKEKCFFFVPVIYSFICSTLCPRGEVTQKARTQVSQVEKAQGSKKSRGRKNKGEKWVLMGAFGNTKDFESLSRVEGVPRWREPRHGGSRDMAVGNLLTNLFGPEGVCFGASRRERADEEDWQGPPFSDAFLWKVQHLYPLVTGFLSKSEEAEC